MVESSFKVLWFIKFLFLQIENRIVLIFNLFMIQKSKNLNIKIKIFSEFILFIINLVSTSTIFTASVSFLLKASIIFHCSLQLIYIGNWLHALLNWQFEMYHVYDWKLTFYNPDQLSASYPRLWQQWNFRVNAEATNNAISIIFVPFVPAAMTWIQ